jgi:hypothetical protein
MNSVGNLKLAQLRTLLRIFRYSLIKSLSIFGLMEGISFEFTSWGCFWKIGKFLDRVGPPVSARFQTVPPPSESRRYSYSCCQFATTHRFPLPIKPACGREENPFSHFASSSLSSMLCLALLNLAPPCHPSSLLTGEHHHRPPPSPSELT